MAKSIFDMLGGEKELKVGKNLYYATIVSFNEEVSKRGNNYTKYEIYDKNGRLDMPVLMQARDQLWQYAVQTNSAAENTLSSDDQSYGLQPPRFPQENMNPEKAVELGNMSSEAVLKIMGQRAVELKGGVV